MTSANPEWLEMGFKFPNVNWKKLVSSKQHTQFQARVQTIPYFTLKCSKSISHFTPKQLKTHTLCCCTYLDNLYKGTCNHPDSINSESLDMASHCKCTSLWPLNFYSEGISVESIFCCPLYLTNCGWSKQKPEHRLWLQAHGMKTRKTKHLKDMMNQRYQFHILLPKLPHLKKTTVDWNECKRSQQQQFLHSHNTHTQKTTYN